MGTVYKLRGDAETIVRPARAQDRDAIKEMLGACGAFTAEEVTVALELFDEGRASDASYSLFVADHSGRVRGYVCLGRAALTQHSWYLYWICVHPTVQSQGIGHALQRHSEAFVRAQRGHRLVLETSGRPDYDQARRFYDTEGYAQAGRIANFYRPGDDCLIYVKEIP